MSIGHNLRYKVCSHGKKYSDPCPRCDVLWAETRIRDAEAMLARHQRQLEAAKKLVAQEENSGGAA